MQNRLFIIILVVLILFGLYRRVRRTVGFQYLVRRQLTVRMVLFAILALAILSGGAANPISYVADAFGIVIGGIIAYISARTTHFEMRNDRWGYTQHRWIGIGLIGLLIVRLLVEFIGLSHVGIGKIQQASNQGAPQSYYMNPWTVGILMLLVAYYIGYYIFLLRKVRALAHPSRTGNTDLNER